MKTISIGKQNASYQQLQGLKDNRTKRLRQGAFFVEGVRNINQAIAAGAGLITNGTKCSSDAENRFSESLF